MGIITKSHELALQACQNPRYVLATHNRTPARSFCRAVWPSVSLEEEMVLAGLFRPRPAADRGVPLLHAGKRNFLGLARLRVDRA